MVPKCSEGNATCLLEVGYWMSDDAATFAQKSTLPFYWCTVKRALALHFTLPVVSTQCCRSTGEDDGCLPTISVASTTNVVAKEHPVPLLTSIPIPPTVSFPSCIVGGDFAALLDCWTPRLWGALAPSPHNTVPKNPHRELECCSL